MLYIQGTIYTQQNIDRKMKWVIPLWLYFHFVSNSWFYIDRSRLFTSLYCCVLIYARNFSIILTLFAKAFESVSVRDVKDLKEPDGILAPVASKCGMLLSKNIIYIDINTNFSLNYVKSPTNSVI